MNSNYDKSKGNGSKYVFDFWNSQKKKINSIRNKFRFFEREIWLVSLGQNIGVEINGKKDDFLRPVLIYRKYNIDQCFVLPLTTRGKKNIFYYDISSVKFLKERSFICLSQGRVIDAKRFFRKLGKISVGQFVEIKKSAQAMLEPQSPRWP